MKTSDKLPEMTLELEGWALYALPEKLSPLVDILNSLEKSQIDKIRASLQRLRGVYEENGLEGLRGIKQFHPAHGRTSDGFLVPGLFFLQIYTENKTPYSFYVAFENGVPLVLDIARQYGDDKVFKVAENAGRRLLHYREGPGVARPAFTPLRPQEISIDPTLNSSEQSPTVANTFPTTQLFSLVSDDRLMQLVELKQEIAGGYERIFSDRQVRYTGKLQEVQDGVDRAIKEHDRATAQTAEISRQLESLKSQKSQATQQELPSTSPSFLERLAFWKTKKIDESTPNDRQPKIDIDTAALEKNLAVASAHEKASAAWLLTARATFQSWLNMNLTSVEVIPELDTPEIEQEVPSLEQICKHARALGIEIGQQLLSDPTHSLPVVQNALGQRSSPTDDLSLVAADIVCFHFLQGLPTDGSVPAYGKLSMYPEDSEARAIYLDRAARICGMQCSVVTQKVKLGEGLDPDIPIIHTRPDTRLTLPVENLVVLTVPSKTHSLTLID